MRNPDRLRAVQQVLREKHEKLDELRSAEIVAVREALDDVEGEAVAAGAAVTAARKTLDIISEAQDAIAALYDADRALDDLVDAPAAEPVTDPADELAAARAEIDRLRTLCAEVYQVAGALDADARVLDNLWAAAGGQPLPHESLVPYQAPTRLDRATETIADGIAQELIQDPEFKAQLRVFVARAFSRTPDEDGSPGGCFKIQIPEACCYVRFGARPSAGVTSDMIGQTVRGERLIADFDAEGRIIGIELVGGVAKPCQLTPAEPPPAATSD